MPHHCRDQRAVLVKNSWDHHTSSTDPPLSLRGTWLLYRTQHCFSPLSAFTIHWKQIWCLQLTLCCSVTHFSFYPVQYGTALQLAAAAYRCGNSSILAISEAVQAQIGELSQARRTQPVVGNFVMWWVSGGATPAAERKSSVEVSCSIKWTPDQEEEWELSLKKAERFEMDFIFVSSPGLRDE